jgi:hypothetical protein
VRRFSGLLTGVGAGVADAVAAGEETAEPDASADADGETAEGAELVRGAGVTDAEAVPCSCPGSSAGRLLGTLEGVEDDSGAGVVVVPGAGAGPPPASSPGF